jgi:hypothetical protein
LRTDVKAQLELITAINQKLVKRSENLTGDNPILLESIAYQIHNLYGSTEDLLKIVAAYFENNIAFPMLVRYKVV